MDENKKYKGVEPIPNTDVLGFLQMLNYEDWLSKDSDWIYSCYRDTFLQWIQSSNLNTLNGIENFKHKQYSFGTTQTFDLFYLQNKNRRFRFFKGDFFYHTACNTNWEYLDTSRIDTNDAVIISVPFSDTGNIPNTLEFILCECDVMGVPVLLDMCYYVIGKDININLNHKCILILNKWYHINVNGMGIGAGINLEKLIEVSNFISNSLNRNPQSKLALLS